jgi:hypothetical protein
MTNVERTLPIVLSDQRKEIADGLREYLHDLMEDTHPLWDVNGYFIQGMTCAIRFVEGKHNADI